MSQRLQLSGDARLDGNPAHPMAELSLSALLDDDLVRMVMRRDGVTPAQIKALGKVVPLVSKTEKKGAGR